MLNFAWFLYLLKEQLSERKQKVALFLKASLFKIPQFKLLPPNFAFLILNF